jgi:hypothetical protein
MEILKTKKYANFLGGGGGGGVKISYLENSSKLGNL